MTALCSWTSRHVTCFWYVVIVNNMTTLRDDCFSCFALESSLPS